MRLSSLRLVSLAAQQTRASVSSLVLFNLPQPGLPVCDLTISSESKVMKLLMPHSCFQLGVFFSLKRNMSRRMEFSKLSLKGTSVQPILHIHGFSTSMDSTNLRVKILKKEKIKIPKRSKKEKAKSQRKHLQIGTWLQTR